MNITITDYYSGANRGDAAILEGVIESVRNHIPEADFTVITENVSAAELINGVDAYEQQISPQQWKQWMKSAKLENVLSSKQKEIYSESDVVISTGGHLLTDAYFPAKIGMLLELYYCSRLNCSVALFAQTIGPLNNEPYRFLTQKVLKKLDLITVRDQRSLDVLNSLGTGDVPVHFTADAAFSMRSSPPRELPLADRMNENVPSLKTSNETTVTISVREISEFYGPDSEERYIKLIAHLSEYLSGNMGSQVVFISTCTGITGYDKDDRLTAHRVIDSMDKGSAKVVQGEYTPYDLVDIFKESDLHFGTRMHSCILAAKAGTPIVGIEYQFKVRELFKQLELENFVIEIDDLTKQSLLDLARLAYEDCEEIETRLNQKVPILEKEADRNGELLSEILTS